MRSRLHSANALSSLVHLFEGNEMPIRTSRYSIFVCLCLVLGDRVIYAGDIIKAGKALGSIWYRAEDTAAADKRVPTEKDAAAELAGFLEKMSGARVEIKSVPDGERPGQGEPAIVLGRLAIAMGLTAPPRTPSLDGYRIQTRGDHLLMAGESSASTGFAVTHFLESLGCRWLMPNQWGEIIPRSQTISLDGLDVEEKPDFLFREVWGWGSRARGRLGGMDLPNRHDWEHLPAKQYFEEHPEYFALRRGERRPSNWVCTSDPAVAPIFAEAYIAKARTGQKADTISPPDGRGFCECEKCRALDVPGYFEPSSGTLSMTDRYVIFFDEVAKRVAAQAPDFILSFYCYSDYTLPPKRIAKASDNLCAWVTTIRFCRLHGINNPNCESRQRYKKVVEGWAKLMQTACYEYNYNLAEVTVPISKISAFKDNIPFLKKTGCLGINLESMAAWNLYGPHTYLANRLMWDADGDADAILDDYYEKLCGKAAPLIKSYWERIDKACRESEVHVGSFYGVHAIWTADLLKQCQADLDSADKTAETDREKGAVALFRSGLESARYYLLLRGAINRCDFVSATKLYDNWIAHMDDAFEQKFNTMGGYKYGYLKWFLLPSIKSGFARTTGECKLLQQLSDEWQLRYDPENEGEGKGWSGEKIESEDWKTVSTYSASLNEQKVPEQLTWMWYRTRFKVPDELPEGRLSLWFAEVDGSPTKVFLNGQPIGEFTGERQPNEVDITGKLIPGREYTVTIRTGHHNISELMLGGILKPVMIYCGTPKGELK